MYIRVAIPLKLIERKNVEDKINKAEVFIFPFTNIIELVLAKNGIQRKFVGIKKDIMNLIQAYGFENKEVTVHNLKFGEHKLPEPVFDYIFLYSENTDISFIANERYPVARRAKYCSDTCSRTITNFFLSTRDIRKNKLNSKYKYKYKFDKNKISSNLLKVTNVKTKVSKSCVLKEVKDSHLILMYPGKEKNHVFSVGISSILNEEVKIEREGV